ncbi:DMT family transporter [Salinicola salarius]|uniref:DMT family transporter n=1 Tax=Salinicola salarius TaxID=430457 RepID=UPI00358E046B
MSFEAAFPWLYLILTGLFEIAWAYSMKQSHGLTRLAYTGMMLVTILESFVLLSLAMVACLLARPTPFGLLYEQLGSSPWASCFWVNL